MSRVRVWSQDLMINSGACMNAMSQLIVELGNVYSMKESHPRHVCCAALHHDQQAAPCTAATRSTAFPSRSKACKPCMSKLGRFHVRLQLDHSCCSCTLCHSVSLSMLDKLQLHALCTARQSVQGHQSKCGCNTVLWR